MSSGVGSKLEKYEIDIHEWMGREIPEGLRKPYSLVGEGTPALEHERDIVISDGTCFIVFPYEYMRWVMSL